MREVKAVLVATDFSEHGHQAVEAAIAIARTFEARIEVVHAFQTPVPIVSPYEVVVPAGFIEQAREAAAKNLGAVVDRISSEGIPVKPHLTEVPAAPAIARLAKELDVDLVVIGTRGHTGLKHVLLGSVAERTIRLAPCSVLTVKPHED
jgi:universal stress protein A